VNFDVAEASQAASQVGRSTRSAGKKEEQHQQGKCIDASDVRLKIVHGL
jgi:hypothetical protein